MHRLPCPEVRLCSQEKMLEHSIQQVPESAQAKLHTGRKLQKAKTKMPEMHPKMPRCLLVQTMHTWLKFERVCTNGQLYDQNVLST